MKLTYKNYTAEEEEGRFNLYKDVEMKATKDTERLKKGDEYTNRVLIGYGFTFERLLKRITESELSTRKDMTLHGYIYNFKAVLDDLRNTLGQ